MGKQWKQWLTLFFWAPKPLPMVNAAMKLKSLAPWKKSNDQPRQHIKKQRHYFANKGPSSQSCGFSSSHVWMWELDYKESQVLRNWSFWTIVLEKTLETLLDCKEMKPVHPKENQSWIFIGRTDKLKLQYFGHLIQSTDSLEKILMLGKLRAEGDDRWWDGWMASLTQWTWVWANSGRQWRTGKPGVLQSMVSQRVGHDLATKQQQQKLISYFPGSGNC